MSVEGIINKVQLSGLITIDLEEYFHPGEKVLFDIKSYLYEEIILKEKDFRAHLKEHNWEQYAGKNVAITCSVDAIIPTWAYMLVATKLGFHANLVVFGTLKDLHAKIFSLAISQINAQDYSQSKVVIKGCGKLEVPVSAYVELTNKLLPIVSSIMYGEPCSTVPVYKQLK